MPHRTRPGFVCAALGALLAAGSIGCSSPPASPSPLPGATAGAPATADQQGFGNTPYRLAEAGWVCVDVPMHGVHCQDPHVAQGGVHVQVKVFDTSDVQSKDAKFLGTESLIRADHYQGQPCLPGHGEYFLLPFGYYACHHFDF